jgi:hypothetical protein
MHSNVRWWADTLVYLELAKNQDLGDVFFKFDGNLLGPILIASMLDSNVSSIAIFNCFLFLFSYFKISSNFRVHNNYLIAAFILSPMLMVSILTLSKEMIGFFMLIMFLCHLNSRSKTAVKIFGFLVIVSLSFLVRWQQSLTLIMFALSEIAFNYLQSRNFAVRNLSKFRFKFLMLVLVILSILYPYLNSNTDIFSSLSDQVTEDSTRGGSIVILNNIQNYYFGYLIVFLPKLLLNYFGDCLKIVDFLVKPNSIDYNDAYTNFIIPFQQLLMFFVVSSTLTIKVIRKELNFSSFTIYFAALYSAIYALSPFIQSRYFFPLYPVFCLDLFTNYNRSRDAFSGRYEFLSRAKRRRKINPI